MDRVRGQFVAASKPTYDDPQAVETHDTGFFEKDPGEAPTQATADWCNLITEELRNLVVALGGTPATDDDTQISTLLGRKLDDAYRDEYHWPSGPALVLVAAGSANVEILTDRAAGSADTNCAISGDAATAVHPLKHATLGVTSSASSEGCRVYSCESDGTESAVVGDLDNSIVEFEAIVSLSAVGASQVNVGFGLHATPDTDNPTSSDRFALIIKDSSDTNWQCKAANASAITSHDSGVAPVASTYQKLRVEYHGANTPRGVDAGSAVCRFYIDGSLVDTIDSNVPSTSLGFVAYARATATGPSSQHSTRVGPVKLGYQVLAA